MIPRTRFAPSPTGPLHLGHAYSAIFAHDLAIFQGGEFLLRIEDIDTSRARPAWETQIYQDLAWLGLTWPLPVMRQSDRLGVYKTALRRLWNAGLLYACHCNRRDISEAVSAPQGGSATLIGPDGIVYPGTCRGQGLDPSRGALRLDIAHAVAHISSAALHFSEKGERVHFAKDELIHGVGDFVLARRDMGTSYHLAVVIDDAAQQVTTVTRGEDLFETTRIHVFLQILMGLPSPDYHHHRLLCNDDGKRLAKRDDARAIARYREEGATPSDIRRMVGL